MKRKYVKVNLEASEYWNPDFLIDHKMCSGLFEIIREATGRRYVKRVTGYVEHKAPEWALSKHHGPTIEREDGPDANLDEGLFEL
jgi:hypothetical protein